MPRTYDGVFVDRNEGIDKDPLQEFEPRVNADVQVSWTLSFDTSSVLGFNVALVEDGFTPLTATPVRLAFVDDPTKRLHLFADVPAGDYKGWVQVVIEGNDGEWVSSGASPLVVEDDQIPTVRTGDDRTVNAFVEDFRNASLPVGFSVLNGSYVLTTDGRLRITATNDGCYLEWRLDEWLTEYLDPQSRKSGLQNMTAIIKCGVTNTLHPLLDAGETYPTFSFKEGSGSFVASGFVYVNDGKEHQYHIPLGLVYTKQAPYVVLRFYPYLVNGGVIDIDAICMAYKNTDMSLDGNVDRGLNARNNFDTAEGGDFFLTSPFRKPDALGNLTLVNENGLFYLRDSVSGNYVTESGYKIGRSVKLPPSTASTFVSWDDLGIPEPIALNKVRVVIQPAGQEMQPAAPSANYPKVYVADASEMTTGAAAIFGGVNTSGVSGIRIHTLMCEGFTQLEASDSGPWSTSSEAKSALACRNAASSVATLPAYDAWYRGSDGLSSAVDVIRIVAFIDVQMPPVFKPDGSPYWFAMAFYIWHGAATPSGSQLNFSSSTSRQVGPICVRVFCDGRTVRFPLVIGASSNTIDSATARWYQYANVKIDWVGFKRELDALTAIYPVSVNFNKVSMSLLQAGSTWNYLYHNQQQFNAIYLEEA